MKRLIAVVSVASICGVVVASATAGSALTRAQYLAKLQGANAQSTKADNAAGAAVASKTTTAAQVRAAFLAMAKRHIAIGRSFSAITPPRAALKANGDFARAEIVFGQQNEAIAKKLPDTKAALLKYIQSLKPPSGGRMLDRAISELHAAGFKI